MTLVTQQEQDAIAAAITEVERLTDAELVTVLAAQSDDYRYIPTLWAALLALLTPLCLSLSNYWLDPGDTMLAQFGVFMVMAAVFRWRPLMFLLLPRTVREWRASNLARRQFLEQNLHHTKGDTGVLIFVSEAERYVEIIADRGIDQHVSAQQWQAIIDDFSASVHSGATAEGFINCIQACGKLMIEHAPVSGEKNELPNHLIILD
ncbi:MAG: putative membrane protein [Halieaceae bacterium]|jgi:putative membrane protein